MESSYKKLLKVKKPNFSTVLFLPWPMEGLKVSKANLTAYIHPSKTNQVSQPILRQLSSLLFKSAPYHFFQTSSFPAPHRILTSSSFPLHCRFSEIFHGVVLAYDLNSLHTCAKILPGVHPYFGVKLKVNLLLFSPKPNMLLGTLSFLLLLLSLSFFFLSK